MYSQEGVSFCSLSLSAFVRGDESKCLLTPPHVVRQEALESAMGSGLWGHALFLASKMDNRSYTTVLNR